MDISIYIYIYIYILSTSPPRHPILLSEIWSPPPWTSFHFDSVRTTIHSSPIVLFRHTHTSMIQDAQSTVFSPIDWWDYIDISLLIYQTLITHPDISAATDVDQTPPRLFAQRYVRVHESTNISLSYLTTDEISESLHSMHRNEWGSAFADFYLWNQTSLFSKILVQLLFSLLCCLAAQEFESDSNSWAKCINKCLTLFVPPFSRWIPRQCQVSPSYP